MVALLAASVGAYAALLAWRFRHAPGLADQGWFALVALTTAGYSGLNVIPASAGSAGALIVWAAKLQLLLAAIHAVAWFRYCSAWLGRPWPREAAAGWALLAAALPLLLPGVGYDGTVRQRPVDTLDLIYRDARPTTFGALVMVAVLAILVAVLARFFAAWRREVPYAGVHLASLGLLLGMAVNDALVVTGHLRGVYVLDLGFLAPLAAVTYALSGRVVEEARALARQWALLERTVVERTAELASSREALLRAEKLAALGQFSAGVSHEVSNPAAAVAANLRYLEEALQAGSPPPDALECLAESRQSVEQIARLTRQLLDASRLASGPRLSGGRLALAEVVAGVVAEASPRLDGREVLVQVPADLEALGQAAALSRVLDRLLDNALRSLRPGQAGRVAVRGERGVGRVRLVVEDDGVGMDQETLARAFDPFFSTRLFGTGKGLGLAVARGLLQAMRGDLRLERAPGGGTRAIVELPLAEAPPLTPPSGSPPRPR